MRQTQVYVDSLEVFKQNGGTDEALINIPTLQEVLAIVGEKMLLNVQVDTPTSEEFGKRFGNVWPSEAPLFPKLLDRTFELLLPLHEKVILSSFDHHFLEKIKVRQ